MAEVTVANERIKKTYLHYLVEGEGLAEKTIEHTRRAIAEFERFTGRKDFKNFSSKDAIAFRKSLLRDGGKQAAEQSNRATVHGKLMRVEKFFRWLSYQPGYKRITVADTRYFGLCSRDRQLAKVRQEKYGPSLDQVLKVIRNMQTSSAVELRNRALLACLLLTGSRVKALTDLKLKHVLPGCMGISFDAREVETKGSKTFVTYFYRLADDVQAMLVAYFDYLRTQLGWRPEDPLFPRTKQTATREHGFEVTGLARAHWKTTEPLREILREACAAAGVPYFKPHTIRNMLAEIGARRSSNGEEYKAWSQNMAHEDTSTTWRSYGTLTKQRQAELISQLDAEAERPQVNSKELLAELAKLVRGGKRD
jgi:site-specific recombinase XerD